jgi:DNA-binding NtrC family response regulator
VTEPDERGQPSVFERHPWLLDMRLLIQSIADTGSSVLIRGESSRMCEIVAEAIHASCPRGGVFVRIYCGAVSPDLCEAELFGVEEKSGRKGGLVEFRESTLYIHDIAKMPPVPQAKLLQTLQDHRVLRQGGRVPIDVDIRVVAATNGDLEAAVSRGEFLEELYRLLKTAEISAPPLTKEERDLARAEAEEQARRYRAWREPIDAHNEACRAFARISQDEGFLCPHCVRRSQEDFEFVDYAGQGWKSYFVCLSCGRSFGHEL